MFPPLGGEEVAVQAERMAGDRWDRCKLIIGAPGVPPLRGARSGSAAVGSGPEVWSSPSPAPSGAMRDAAVSNG